MNVALVIINAIGALGFGLVALWAGLSVYRERQNGPVSFMEYVFVLIMTIGCFSELWLTVLAFNDKGIL